VFVTTEESRAAATGDGTICYPGRSFFRASKSGSPGSRMLGVGSYQKLAALQSSAVSISRPFSQPICWMVMRTSFCQRIGSRRC
jgi:hypothetical protein